MNRKPLLKRLPTVFNKYTYVAINHGNRQNEYDIEIYQVKVTTEYFCKLLEKVRFANFSSEYL